MCEVEFLPTLYDIVLLVLVKPKQKAYINPRGWPK